MTTTEPFADPSDVATALLRPLTDNEQAYVPDLLVAASALLRQAAPSIDMRLAKYDADPTDASAVSPLVVAAVIATVVKRVVVNPQLAASMSQTDGPFSTSLTFARKQTAQGDDTSAVLRIDASDLAILFPSRKRLRAGTIRTRAALAPRPVGRYGMPTSLGESVSAIVTFSKSLPPSAEPCV